MKTNNYNVEKIIDALNNHGYTNFLTRQELMLVKGKLRHNEYEIYELYPECSKVILYHDKLPDIKLFKIENSSSLTHRDILGTIYSLGLNEDTFGDIIKYHDSFYFFIMAHLDTYFKSNLTNIKNLNVTLTEVPLSLKDEFALTYYPKEYIVSSLRIDNIVSTITNESRKSVLAKFTNNEVNLNYNDNVKPTKVLEVGDIFSIRRYGKYKYNGIKKITKKGGFIIEILIYN